MADFSVTSLSELYLSAEENADVLCLSARQFFDEWKKRNETRQILWDAQIPLPLTTGPFSTLQEKVQILKAEVQSLIAQDSALFTQLFGLEEALSDLRDQISAELNSTSSITSSPYLSPCSSLSGSADSATGTTLPGPATSKRTSSFVRNRVSYPPSSRNRSRRGTGTPLSTPQHTHMCQDSYDSGIHNSDHEIFV